MKEQIVAEDALLSTIVIFPGLKPHEFAIATMPTTYANVRDVTI